MVAEFNFRDTGSNFHRILTNRPHEFQRGEMISASLFIKSANDKHLQFIAKMMKRNKEIISWDWHWQSGKLLVTWPNGQVTKFVDPAALLQTASKTVCDKAKDFGRSK